MKKSSSERITFRSISQGRLIMYIDSLKAKVIYHTKEDGVSAAIYREGKLIVHINDRESSISIANEVMEEIWKLTEK